MCTAFGSPWPATAIVKAGGAVLWPLTFYQVRWQWWLRYYGTDKQVLVGDTVRIGIVADIRQCGRIAISYAKKITWVSPACQGQPKFPQLWQLNLPHPVQESFASSARTSPAFSFSLSR